MMPRSTGLLVVFLILFVAPSAWTADDHLKCFKVKDGLKRQPYTADLSGLVAQAGCIVSVPAVFVCLPSDNTNPQPTPPQEGGGPPTGGFACYRVRCPRDVLPPVVIEDQYGTRSATPTVTRMICAPLGQSASVTTTIVPVTTTISTSTTVPNTTTSTTLLSLACPYTGPPVFDPDSYPACSPACGGAHCVPASFVPAGQQSAFATCAGGFCVPDPVIATAGNYIPPSCDPFPGTGAAGRCLSTCLPSIAAQPSLEQSTCAAGNRCAPCFDPFTGASTGACSMSCDAPPATPFKFPTCCSDGTALTGTCVPSSQLPADLQSKLTQSGNGNPAGCPTTAAQYLCVPNEYLPGGIPITCTVLGGGPGACVSLCVDDSSLAFFNQAACPAHHVCVPCALNPTTPGCAP